MKSEFIKCLIYEVEIIKVIKKVAQIVLQLKSELPCNQLINLHWYLQQYFLSSIQFLENFSIFYYCLWSSYEIPIPFNFFN